MDRPKNNPNKEALYSFSDNEQQFFQLRVKIFNPKQVYEYFQQKSVQMFVISNARDRLESLDSCFDEQHCRTERRDTEISGNSGNSQSVASPIAMVSSKPKIDPNVNISRDEYERLRELEMKFSEMRNGRE